TPSPFSKPRERPARYAGSGRPRSANRDLRSRLLLARPSELHACCASDHAKGILGQENRIESQARSGRHSKAERTSLPGDDDLGMSAEGPKQGGSAHPRCGQVSAAEAKSPRSKQT